MHGQSCAADVESVPAISRFYGITIAIHYRDHDPPHFHARYGEHHATIEIETSRVLAGSLPATARKLVSRWTELHRDELRNDWQLARERLPLDPIAPLE